MKKVSLSFSELASVLGYSNIILGDKSVNATMKNIIFLASEESVKIVGYNAFTFARTTLQEVSSIEVGDTPWEFQISASDLNKIISSFSNMYKTTVKDIDFEEEGVKIKLTLHEVPLKEEDSQLAQSSEFLLESAPIAKNILQEVHMEFPETVDVFQSGDLLLYVDSLLPLMSSDSASSISGKLNFAEDYVFVIASHMSAFFVNKLPDAFKKLSLSYSSVNFLKKLCESSEDLGIARIDKYICIQSGNTEAFMRYQNVKVNYSQFVERRSKEKGILVDRLYLRDVLRRMSNVSPDGNMYISENSELQVENASFSQVIPLLNMKEGTEGINFKISVPIINNLIIGKDDVFNPELFMYFVEKNARGYTLYMSDKSGAWFSNMSVTRI